MLDISGVICIKSWGKKSTKKKNSKLHSKQAHTEIDKHFSTSLCAFQLCAIFLFSPFKVHQHAQGKDNVAILFQFFSSLCFVTGPRPYHRNRLVLIGER